MDDLVLIGFNVAAALYLALSVAYLADEIVSRMVGNRVAAPVVAFETIGIVLFTWITFGVATEPQQISALNGVVNWIALTFEVVVIVRAVLRGYRAIKGTARHGC